MTPEILELRAGELRLALRPDLGASIAGLWLGELPVLRSADAMLLADPRDSASFAMAPYSNRLGYRRFRWQGADYTTAPNWDGPHSLHGVAFRRPWRTLAADADRAELVYAHAPDAHWPFAFTLTQRFLLAADGLRVELALRNEAALAQPVGLGWHPYFPKRTRSRLHVDCAARWDADDTGLPTRTHPQPGIDADVAHLDFDHCFEGWPGHARIRDEKLALRLRSSLPYLVVYTPPTKPYFCVEPVSHVNNAIHMADPAVHGLRTLQPGDSFEAWMSLDVARA